MVTNITSQSIHLISNCKHVFSMKNSLQKNQHLNLLIYLIFFFFLLINLHPSCLLPGTSPLSHQPPLPFSAPAAAWVQVQRRRWWWQWATQRSNWGRVKRRRRGAAWSSSQRKEKGQVHWTANGWEWALVGGRSWEERGETMREGGTEVKWLKVRGCLSVVVAVFCVISVSL